MRIPGRNALFLREYIMRLGITVTRKGGYHFLNNTDLISPSYQDYRTILAIPQSEIDVNPNIKQNEGYF